MIDQADTSDEQQSRDDIWSARAAKLVQFIKGSTPPVKTSTLCVWAGRYGWAIQTLEACLDYCVEMKLLATYKSFAGEKAWKIPLTPVHEEEGAADAGEAVTMTRTQAEIAGAVRASDCLCARTAPAVNYGCPEHGAARRGAEEKQEMAKDWITSAEAAKLIGISSNRALYWAAQKKIETKVDESFTGSGRKPVLFKRSSVIAFRDSRSGDGNAARYKPGTPAAATDLLDELPRTKRVVSKRAKVVRAPKPVQAPAPSGDLAADVRALVHNIERGWMPRDAAWEILRDLVS